MAVPLIIHPYNGGCSCDGEAVFQMRVNGRICVTAFAMVKSPDFDGHQILGGRRSTGGLGFQSFENWSK